MQRTAYTSTLRPVRVSNSLGWGAEKSFPPTMSMGRSGEMSPEVRMRCPSCFSELTSRAGLSATWVQLMSCWLLLCGPIEPVDIVTLAPLVTGPSGSSARLDGWWVEQAREAREGR